MTREVAHYNLENAGIDKAANILECGKTTVNQRKANDDKGVNPC